MSPGICSGTKSEQRAVHLYLHTHWDREWYRSFEGYRYRLIRSLKNILAHLESHPERKFLLDGQTVVLEDYLALYPEDTQTLTALITEGRLDIGPWYVLPDEFLVSGEALIRNLQQGMAQARSFGQQRFCAYLPDMFGHPAQIPQILQQSGLAPAVIWRGVMPDSAYFSWQGLSGKAIPTQHLTKGYYQDALHMETPDKALMASFLEAINAATPEHLPLLLPVGADHMGLPERLEEKLEWLSENFPDYTFIQSTLLDYLEALPPLEVSAPPTYTGELRQPDGAYVLPGVWSSRYPLKLANAQCEQLLEREIEPLLVFQQLSGATPPLWPVLHHAWKTLLLNHPHDSICGCSIDEVHQDMLPRFRWVKQMAEELRQDAYIHWGKHTLGQQPGDVLNLVNTGPHLYKGYQDIALVFAKETPCVQLRHPDGNLCPLWILPPDTQEKHPHETFIAEPEILPHWEDVHRVRCRIYVELPALSSTAYVIETPEVLSEAQMRQPIHHADEVPVNDQWELCTLNNDKVRVRFDAHHRSLIFERKIDQVWIHQVSGHCFIHEGDAGDEYNFSPPQAPQTPAPQSFGFNQATILHGPGEQTLLLRAEINIPAGLNTSRTARDTDTVPLVIETRIQLFEDSESFHFHTTVYNTARDYRLKLLWQPALPPTATRSSTLLGALHQAPPHLAEWDAPKGHERPVDEFPFQEWIHVKQPDQNGWCFQSTGIYEASLAPWEDEPALSLTLLRCTGWLSRDDLRTRGGGAGPRMPTPEAQCLGTHEYDYHLHLCGADETRTLQRVGQYRHPILHFQGQATTPHRLFEADFDTLHLSALKIARDNPHAVVLRVVNESSREQVLELTPKFDWHSIYLSNPLEEAVEPLARYGQSKLPSQSLQAGDIATYLIVLKEAG
jgi:mannosylglycerate hydrolase